MFIMGKEIKEFLELIKNNVDIHVNACYNKTAIKNTI